ncbi:hypothetical protein [Rhodococcoides fascians]|uniref:hypothetical protein n=1 Tax=Rhodococcoides fascians TaxID=1828 RepID=UPI000A6EA4EE|nr:hypothetical protein [Rhodococcus fascians]
MSTPIDSDAGWAAYEKVSAELAPASNGDGLAVLLSAMSIVGLAVLIVLAYIPGGTA